MVSWQQRCNLVTHINSMSTGRHVSLTFFADPNAGLNFTTDKLPEIYLIILLKYLPESSTIVVYVLEEWQHVTARAQSYFIRVDTSSQVFPLIISHII